MGERTRFGAECQGVDHESKGPVRRGMSGHTLCVVNSRSWVTAFAVTEGHGALIKLAVEKSCYDLSDAHGIRFGAARWKKFVSDTQPTGRWNTSVWTHFFVAQYSTRDMSGSEALHMDSANGCTRATEQPSLLLGTADRGGTFSSAFWSFLSRATRPGEMVCTHRSLAGA